MNKIKFISTADYFYVVKKVFNRTLNCPSPEGAQMKLWGLNPDLCQQQGSGVPNVLLSELIANPITEDTPFVCLGWRPLYKNREQTGYVTLLLCAVPCDSVERLESGGIVLSKFVAISAYEKNCTLTSKTTKMSFSDAPNMVFKKFPTGGTGHGRPLYLYISQTGKIRIETKNHTGCDNDHEDLYIIPMQESALYIQRNRDLTQDGNIVEPVKEEEEIAPKRVRKVKASARTS